MKLLKRVLLGILILFAALVVFLAGSIAVDYVVGGNRLDNLVNVTIPGMNGGPDIGAYVEGWSSQKSDYVST